MPDSVVADQTSADDWAVAMAEQKSAVAPDASASAPAPKPKAEATPIFRQLSGGDALANANDIDLIMDIPVLLTVELLVPAAWMPVESVKALCRWYTDSKPLLQTATAFWPSAALALP